MIALSLATLAFTTPPGGLRALGTRAPGRRCAVLLQAGPDRKDIDAEISLAARVDERWKFLRDNPGMDAAEAADNAKANPMQRSKDTRLAERDTRQWCLDRCLATGYCEVIEDLWELSSEQVMAFCEHCAEEDECELVYDKADEYMGHLSSAASTASDADEGFGLIGSSEFRVSSIW
uniref:Uncharacterized protein n=1 Tax=Phaeocystis antarctica TaxID=33657 RepID=A0A7S0EQH5_9EUKA